MVNRKRSLILFSLVALMAIVISACEKPYSTVPLETPAAEETSLFVSPFPTSDNPMAMVEELSTGTAMAETAVALTAGTPPAAQAESTEITPDSDTTQIVPADSATATNTPPLSNASPTATQQAAPTAIINAPGTYTLQKGEHPYCIARRFNVNPDELLAASGLTRDQAYSLSTGTTLRIPDTGNPFPGTRALRSHPDTYTVADATMTVYGVACAYGDVSPDAIVSANPGLSLSSALTVGQQINIP